MNQTVATVARKLLNLYRQEHVIFGGWAAVNSVFVEEATPEVIDALNELPTGKMLVQHIENLRSGRTPMDRIERDLLPYGGIMAEKIATITLTKSELNDISHALNEFTTDQEGLTRIQSLDCVKKFGNEWLIGIRAALSEHPDLLEKWSLVYKTHRAYYLWKIATDMLATPMSERARAQLQADMPDYETYLPMFGDAGTELLNKLRNFIRSIVHPEQE